MCVCLYRALLRIVHACRLYCAMSLRALLLFMCAVSGSLCNMMHLSMSKSVVWHSVVLMIMYRKRCLVGLMYGQVMKMCCSVCRVRALHMLCGVVLPVRLVVPSEVGVLL